MSKNGIAVIGERESILGFQAVGFDIYPTGSPEETAHTIHRLAKEYPILYITEQALAPVAEELERYRSQPLPAIIPIPGRTGSLGLGLGQVKKSVEKAVGADILFGS